MPQYRAYPIQSTKPGTSSPHRRVIDADTDAEAIAEAMQWFDGTALELWDDVQRVGVIERRSP
jgi:hypothetical protein